MLTLLPYHVHTAELFKKQPKVWAFFASHQQREEQLKEFKTDLLKNTYKFTEESEASLFEKLDRAKEKLGINIPVFLYQAQHLDEMNASILYFQNEAHLVFSGKILQLLNDDELLAVLAHELSHIHLYTQLGGEAEVADRIITSMANHPGSTPAHYETARLFKLYTEIYCDRGAYQVTGSYEPVISSLVKIATGLQTVNAETFLKQADEIFSLDVHTRTSGFSHPENFIRARAISLWHGKRSDAEAIIQQMIEGQVNLDELDIFRQQKIAETTKALINQLLQPTWMHSPSILSLSKQYFGDITPGDLPAKPDLAAHVEKMQGNLQDYVAYVLYDFAVADKTLEDVPLGYCFSLADELKVDKSFANVVKKEKKLTDKKVAQLKKQSLAAFNEQGMHSA